MRSGRDKRRKPAQGASIVWCEPSARRCGPTRTHTGVACERGCPSTFCVDALREGRGAGVGARVSRRVPIASGERASRLEKKHNSSPARRSRTHTRPHILDPNSGQGSYMPSSHLGKWWACVCGGGGGATDGGREHPFRFQSREERCEKGALVGFLACHITF
jgi:hypothetical protein